MINYLIECIFKNSALDKPLYRNYVTITYGCAGNDL